MLAKSLLETDAAVAPEDGPQLQRPESAAEGDRDLAEVERVVGRAQELGDETERVAEVLLAPRPQDRAVHRHAEPLVRVHADGVGALPAGEVIAELRQIAADPAYAASTWSHVPAAAHALARSPGRDRRTVIPVVPIVAMTTHASSAPIRSGSHAEHVVGRHLPQLELEEPAPPSRRRSARAPSRRERDDPG